MKFQPKTSLFQRRNLKPILLAFALTSFVAIVIFLAESDLDQQVRKLQNELAKNMESYGKDVDKGLDDDNFEDDYTGEDTFETQDAPVFGELDANEVTLNNDIFFFVANGAVDLTAREACTVEAAARQHKGKHVFIVFITADVTNIIESASLSYLLSYTNVYFRYIKVSRYMTKASVKDWFVDSDFHKSTHRDAFLGHALTYVFLYKFGGTALNFDVLLNQPIDTLGQFLSRCSEDNIDVYPLTLNSRHPLLTDLLEQMPVQFDKDDPNSIGSKFITNRLKKLCRVSFIKELLYKECSHSSANVLSTSAFCPIEEEKHKSIVDMVRAKLVVKRVEEESSYGVKLWSDLNSDVGDWGSSTNKTAFFRLAFDSCPLMIQSLGSTRHF